MFRYPCQRLLHIMSVLKAGVFVNSGHLLQSTARDRLYPQKPMRWRALFIVEVIPCRQFYT